MTCQGTEADHACHALVLEPFHTISESNRSQREHWARTHRRAKTQRTTAFLLLRHALGLPCPVRLPVTVTLTRIAPRRLDTDNLAGALKHVQDACADYLAGAYGVGQDRQGGLTWHYAQRRGRPGVYAVHLQFEAQA